MIEAKRRAVHDAAHKLAAEIGAVNITKVALCVAAGIPVGSFQQVMGATLAEVCSELPVDKPGRVITKKRVDATRRRQHILETAMVLSGDNGYQFVKRDQLAKAAGVSTGLVTKYFGTMCKLKRAIMRHAIVTSNALIIAQGLAIGDSTARKASDELKAQAAKIITG